MALTRRIKKLKNTQVKKITGRHVLVCKECNEEEVEVSADIVAVTCAYCVQKMIAAPDGYVKEKSDKPRGWHFKLYFEHNGVVYSKGKEITDTKLIAKLKKEASAGPKVATKKTAKTKNPSTKSKKNARTTK